MVEGHCPFYKVGSLSAPALIRWERQPIKCCFEPIFSDIHPLAEHDLVSWLNLYRHQKPSFVKDFLLKTRENHQLALDSLNRLEEILSEDVAVYLGFWM